MDYKNIKNMKISILNFKKFIFTNYKFSFKN